MARLEIYPFDVEVLDKERFLRGVGARALKEYLSVIDPLAEVDLNEDWDNPLIRIGGHDFPGRVEMTLLGGGATLAVVQTWGIPRPENNDIPGAEELTETMADDVTSVRGYALVNVPSCTAKNVIVAELWHRNVTDSKYSVIGALPLLLQAEPSNR